MPLSRLRLRLGAWFAVAYLAGLLVLELSLYAFLHIQSDHRFTRELQGRGTALIEAVLQELHDTPTAGLPGAAPEALREWQGPPGAYAILDSAGVALADRGPANWLSATRDDAGPRPRDLQLGEEEAVRTVVVPHAGAPRFAVRVTASVARIEEDNETLAWWLGLGAPVIVLLGLGGGYVLSRRALAPIDALGDAIAGISPAALDSRLRVGAPPDEVDRVRLQFNALLERLERAQLQNRRFLREAAHQIRTPLTLVMGEASLELQRAQGEGAEVLRRIQLAAEQMQRRVDDLFLLAEARTGAVPPLEESVELDGLLLEAADAMRGRAKQLGRQLRFREVASVSVPGHRGLLREAIVELLENAVRHGDPASPVELGLTVTGEIRLVIASGGAPFSPVAPANDPLEASSDHGLGLPIVQWIVGLHGGRLEAHRTGEFNEVALVIPLSSR